MASPVIHPREGSEGRQKIGRDEGYRWVKGRRKELTEKSVAFLKAYQKDISGKTKCMFTVSSRLPHVRNARLPNR